MNTHSLNESPTANHGEPQPCDTCGQTHYTFLYCPPPIPKPDPHATDDYWYDTQSMEDRAGVNEPSTAFQQAQEMGGYTSSNMVGLMDEQEIRSSKGL